VLQEGDKRRERHHSVSKLLTGVDDMRIQDSLDVGYVNAWSNEDDVRYLQDNLFKGPLCLEMLKSLFLKSFLLLLSCYTKQTITH
jgi:hypothetical protein